MQYLIIWTACCMIGSYSKKMRRTTTKVLHLRVRATITRAPEVMKLLGAVVTSAV